MGQHRSYRAFFYVSASKTRRAANPTRQERRPLPSVVTYVMYSRCCEAARKTATPRFYRGSAIPTANSRLDGAALNRPESPASSRLLYRCGQSASPAAQEQPSHPIRSRADQRTHAPIGQSDCAHPSSAGVSAARQSKLRTVRFRASAKAHSLRCFSSPNHKRFAGLRFGQRTTKGHRSPCGICTDHVQT